MSVRKLCTLTSALLAGALVVMQIGCGLGSSSSGPMIRFINVLAGNGTNTVLLALGSTTATPFNTSPLAYGAYTGPGYAITPTGPVSNEVAYVLSNGNTTTPIVSTTIPSLANSDFYTIAVSGDATQTTTGLAPELNVYQDFLPTSSQLTAVANTAYVRVINLVCSTTSTAYNPLQINNGTAALSGTSYLPNGSTTTTTLTNIAYPQQTNYVQVTVSPQPVLTLVNSQNTTPTSATTTLLSSLSFTAGHAYTVILYGDPSNTSTTVNAPIAVQAFQDE